MEMIRTGRLSSLFATGLGCCVASLPVAAHAHVATGAQSTWCSPHAATESGGGSQFYNCYRESGTDKFHRDYYCPTGTTCSSALCGGSTIAAGHSYSNGGATHNANNRHAPSYTSQECTSVSWNPPQGTAGGSAYDEQVAPDASAARIKFKANGTIACDGNGSSCPGTWAPAVALAGQSFEIKAEVLTGDSPSGPTLGSWHSLGAIDRVWTFSLTSVGVKENAMRITLRHVGTTSPTYVYDFSMFSMIQD